MQRAALLAVTLCACGVAGQSKEKYAQFTTKAQQILDEVSSKSKAAISFAWKDSNHEIQIVAGTTKQLDGTERKVTTDDTFLYGSGSKTFTAAAIMKLVEAGKVSLDDPVEKHVNPWLKRNGNTTLRECWGEMAALVKVKHLIEMRSGVCDYDRPTFDNYVLNTIGETVVSPLEFIKYPGTTEKPFLCIPGTCVEYSSTNFVTAGVILLEYSGSDDWTTLVTKSFYPEKVQQDLKQLGFFTDQPLSPTLTTTATAGFWNCTGGWQNCTRGPSTWVGPQNSSITGWTCANAVAAPREVALFYWDLLHERSVVSQASLETMLTWHEMGKGWGAGSFYYGAGLMLSTFNFNGNTSGKFADWGDCIGHGGMVYGYISNQGYLYGLNATMSLVMNNDQASPGDGYTTCAVAEAAANILHDKNFDWNCDREYMSTAGAAVPTRGVHVAH
eukprot:TRINITY_DN272_c0_g1_i2.p1 TRINITY_DN272_c0_g1~~TRINITY_DN272_c0_g1_i2.p1  ORF type:complete len:476 (+),score=160.18 TRINITY_DN272_c0_g1_i2:102-1430(+)